MYCTVLYCTVLYCTVLYCTVPFHPVPSVLLRHCTFAITYCIVLYCAVLCRAVLLYCTFAVLLLYCYVLYCTVLTVLYPLLHGTVHLLKIPYFGSSGPSAKGFIESLHNERKTRNASFWVIWENLCGFPSFAPSLGISDWASETELRAVSKPSS